MKIISNTGLRNLLAAGGFLMLSSAYVVHEGFSYPDGYPGATDRPGAFPGCTCHSTDESPSTVVRITTDATTFEAGKTYRFKVTVTNPNKVAGGVGVAKWLPGAADTSSSFAVVTGQGLKRSGTLQLVHSTPRTFTDGSASWEFDYKAPPANKPFDTLYAIGNAVNGNGSDDPGDLWSLAPKYVIALSTNSVARRTDIAEGFAIGPNPAQNSTKLYFTLKKASEIRIGVVDAAGREIFVQRISDLAYGRQDVLLDLANVPTGDYLVNVTSEGSLLYTGKICHTL